MTTMILKAIMTLAFMFVVGAIAYAIIFVGNTPHEEKFEIIETFRGELEENIQASVIGRSNLTDISRFQLYELENNGVLTHCLYFGGSLDCNVDIDFVRSFTEE